MKLTDDQVKNRKDWIKALRSGKYLQGSSVLRQSGKFCGLGVLCDVHSKKTKGKWSRIKGSQEYTYKGKLTMPSTPIFEWVGLSASTMAPRFVAMNDVQKLSFSQIADYIESTLPSEKPAAGKTAKTTRKRRRKTNAKS